MNIEMRDYTSFAESIGLTWTKIDGVLYYANKDKSIRLKPFELGELYRAYKEQFIKGFEEATRNFEFYCMEEKVTKDELPAIVAKQVECNKNCIQNLKNEIE